MQRFATVFLNLIQHLIPMGKIGIVETVEALRKKSKGAEDSVKVLDELTAATGCRRERVWETDSMSGINWCSVPVTIVEMGYMTNADEDALMATEDYQWKIARGMANGIEAYLEKE